MSTEINLGDATAAAQLHKLTKKQLQSKDAEIERLEEIVAGESDSSLSVAYEDGRQEAEKEYKHRAEKAEAWAKLWKRCAKKYKRLFKFERDRRLLSDYNEDCMREFYISNIKEKETAKQRAEKAEAENKQLKVELNTAQQIQLTTEGFLNDAEAEVQALEMDAIKAKGETIDERLKR